MNSRYLACPTCRLYVDAGYRWAYWLLEHPGIVRLGEGVDVARILACGDYWSPPEDERSEWLCGEVLPRVRRFLTEHGGHGVVYIEEEHLSAENPSLPIGRRSRGPSAGSEPSPMILVSA